MDYDSHLRAMHPSLCNVVNYGEGQVGSMMALMTDHQEQETEHQQQQQLNILQATTTTAAVHAPSFAYYNATLEPYLQSALFQAAHAFHHIHHVEPQPHCTLEHLDAHAVVNSAEEEKPDLTSKLVHGAGQFIGGRECYISTGPSVLVSPGANSTTHETRVAAAAASMDTDTNNPTDHPDPIRAKIIAHPAYPRLVVAYVNCNKIGAPPEVVTRLDEVSRKYQNFRSPSPSAIGADPELDQFMETYYNVLQKYHEELTQPFKEAMAFFRKIELQLNALSKGSLRLSQSGDDKTEANTQGSSGDEEGEEEGDGSCGEVDFHDDMIDPLAEDHKLKEQLLRKYSGYICSLKQEFLKKKKKGKLPKDARQKLLDWWSQHYKWPYPSEAEKAALAETTGLDQKQINNWFINQRKRHWKPSEDMQYVMVDSPGHAHHHLHVTSAHGPNISFVDNMEAAGTIIPMQ